MFFCLVLVMPLSASVYFCLVVTCSEKADLLALVCVTFPLLSWVRCGTWLYRFLIVALLLTLSQLRYMPRCLASLSVFLLGYLFCRYIWVVPWACVLPTFLCTYLAISVLLVYYDSVTFATVVVRFICLRFSLRFFGIVGGYKLWRLCLHCVRSPYDFFRRPTRTKPYRDPADIVRQPQGYRTIIMLSSRPPYIIARCPYDDLAEVARSRYADCAIVV